MTAADIDLSSSKNIQVPSFMLKVLFGTTHFLWASWRTLFRPLFRVFLWNIICVFQIGWSTWVMGSPEPTIRSKALCASEGTFHGVSSSSTVGGQKQILTCHTWYHQQEVPEHGTTEWPHSLCMFHLAGPGCVQNQSHRFSQSPLCWPECSQVLCPDELSVEKQNSKKCSWPQVKFY